jgi:hypothetical protein
VCLSNIILDDESSFPVCLLMVTTPLNHKKSLCCRDTRLLCFHCPYSRANAISRSILVYPHNSIRQLLILRASECIMHVDWSSSFPKSRPSKCILSPWQTFPLSNEFCNNVLHGLIRATNSRNSAVSLLYRVGQIRRLTIFFIASYWSDSMKCVLILKKWVTLHSINIVLISLKSI